MEPALNHGERVFVSRALAFIGGYDRGDIVMVLVRADYGENQRFIIKRIIAGPGDELQIERGIIFVNNEAMNSSVENFVSGDLSLILGESQYFIMGDNSAYSVDSRNFGTVDKSDIAARVLFRFFPVIR